MADVVAVIVKISGSVWFLQITGLLCEHLDGFLG